MTRNQIEYLALKETRRANLAREAETHRSNIAGEGLTRTRDLEVARSNLVKESLSRDTLAETERSNLAREIETNRSNVAKESETKRSNLAKELEETRSNMAREAETTRHNYVSENTEAVKAGASTVPGLFKPLGALAGLALKTGSDALYHYAGTTGKQSQSDASRVASKLSQSQNNRSSVYTDRRSPIQKQMDAIASAQRRGSSRGSIADPLNIIP